MTCWRRLRDWQHAGICDLTHFVLLNLLSRNGQIDLSRAVVDSCSVRAVFGGRKLGANPTDRAKRGSKRHLVCAGRGIPLAIELTGANCHDSTQALPKVITHAAKLAGLGRVFVHVQTMIQRTPYFCLPQKFSIIQMLLAEVHSTKARCRPSGEGMPQVLKIPSRRHRT